MDVQYVYMIRRNKDEGSAIVEIKNGEWRSRGY
jgi:hypothetical protein